MKQFAAIALACTLSLPVSAKTIATVNGQDISQENLDSFISMLVDQGAQDTPQLRAQATQEMISRIVAVQAAEKEGLQKEPQVRQEIDLARESILVRALMSNYLKDHPVTEADLKKEYDTLKAEQADTKEYKLRHILVESEQDAKDLLAKIKSGKLDFAEAAKKDSIDTGSGKKGGELGWNTTSSYVPEFATAVEGMKKGELSAKPVKSQFGWHLIEVEDERAASFPSFDEAKPQLEKMMRQQVLADYQQSLMKDAKIEEKDAK